MTRHRTWLLVIWLLLFALALSLDRPTALWVHDSGLANAITGRFRWITTLARLPGSFLTFTLPAALVLLLLGWMRRSASPRWWKPAALVFLGGVLSGGNVLVKWIVGRARPFQGEVFKPHFFVGGMAGIGGPNQSFPSGDVCLAAATAVTLCMVAPRGRFIWAALVLIVALQRIAALAHYPSDAVAAVGLGWLLAWLARGVLNAVSPDRNVV